MKFFLVALFTVFLSNSFADEIIIDEIEETLAKYDACTGEGYSQQDLASFKALFKRYKKNNMSVEVTDYSFARVNLLDVETKKECELHTDVYDGRCIYALCN